MVRMVPTKCFFRFNLYFYISSLQGSDIKLILEGETLKLLEPKSKNILHVQPIAKMRVWGVGRVETRLVMPKNLIIANNKFVLLDILLFLVIKLLRRDCTIGIHFVKYIL